MVKSSTRGRENEPGRTQGRFDRGSCRVPSVGGGIGQALEMARSEGTNDHY